MYNEENQSKPINVEEGKNGFLSMTRKFCLIISLALFGQLLSVYLFIFALGAILGVGMSSSPVEMGDVFIGFFSNLIIYVKIILKPFLIAVVFIWAVCGLIHCIVALKK